MTDIAATTEPLWTRARAMFARAVAAIGNPAAIALIAHLSKALRRDIMAWLAPLECIVRRLLIAEATELHRARTRAPNCAPRVETIQLRSLGLANHCPARGSATLRAACAAGAARSKLDTSRPETWRTQFSFALPRNTRLVSNAHAPRIRALWGEEKMSDTHASSAARKLTSPSVVRVCHSFSPPFRLARRLEALRRVLADPRPHAERLARLLVRAARRIPRLVQRYVWNGARSDAVDPDDPRLSLDALAAAFDAPDAYKDTS